MNTSTRRAVVLVVTPVRNGAEYLDQTIQSVLEQRGDFEIRYHVQDGGSSDGTLAIIRHWAARVEEGGGRVNGGAPVQMSWASAPDRSMYDAVQSGFETLLTSVSPSDEHHALMTWINSDDLFAPGAFQTASEVFRDNPAERWVTGIPSIIREDGVIVDVRDPPYAYARDSLAAGRYDGRSRAFLQQEGTFWTVDFWRRIGGLNRDLRLAGDWDLWRRMARESRVVSLRAVLAYHRRRSGQLTTEMAKYWAEVDKIAGDSPASAPLHERDIGYVACWLPNEQRWEVHAVDMAGAQELPSSSDTQGLPLRVDFSRDTWPRCIRNASGLSGAEPWGRWSDAALAPSARITFLRPLPRAGTLRLCLAVLDQRCNPVVVTIGSATFDIRASQEPQEFALAFEADTETDTIDIRASQSFAPRDLGWSSDTRRLGVALHWLEILPGAQARPA
jgi:hypothetical protein